MSNDDATLPGIADVKRAAGRIAGHAVRTPLLSSPFLDGQRAKAAAALPLRFYERYQCRRDKTRDPVVPLPGFLATALRVYVGLTGAVILLVAVTTSI